MAEIVKGGREIKEILEESFKTKKGCLIGRWGTVELECLLGRGNTKVLERNAGVFPSTQSSIEGWKQEYKKAIQSSDTLATGWYGPTSTVEQEFLKYLQWGGIQVPLRSLEPYYVNSEDRWISSLENKKVCIVSSFTTTMESQTLRLDKVWPLDGFFPKGIEWSWVTTGYAPILAQGRGSWSEITCEDIQSWSDAVEYCVREVMRSNPDIVLIGCGGLSMIIGSKLKVMGKACIVLGGSVQVFFGIKGMRWKEHGVIGKFWNESWVWPLEEETPGGAREIEGGCYWGGARKTINI